MDRPDGNRGKRGILLFSNRKYLFALGTFLINLQKHVDYDEVLVYHEGFSDEEIGAVRKIEPRTRFVKYGLEEFAREFRADKEKIASVNFIKVYSVLSVIKFKIFQHLEEFDTVILFDLDMILLDSIEDLLAKKFDLAWRNDNGQTIKYKLNRHGVSDEFIREIGMAEAYGKVETPNGGFLVAQRTFDYQRAYRECVDYMCSYSFRHPFSIDEIMLGYVAAKLGLSVHYVDASLYNVYPISARAKSKLVHLIGPYKPWKNQMAQSVFPDWRRCYGRYVALTGMPSKEVRDFGNISRCLLQDNYRDKWNTLFIKNRFVYPGELNFLPDLSSHSLVFSFHGLAAYKIETSWLMGGCYCTFEVEKKREGIPLGKWQEKLQELAQANPRFLTYQESQKAIGLKTAERSLRDVPDAFYRLYGLTEEFRKAGGVRFASISTYHGTRLYVDLARHMLLHAKEKAGAEVRAAVQGDKCALFISLSGMSVYLKEAGENGEAMLTGRQVWHSCFHNQDGSISIEIKEGTMLSADKNGGVVLRHWDREWEHFSLETVGTVLE